MLSVSDFYSIDTMATNACDLISIVCDHRADDLPKMFNDM